MFLNDLKSDSSFLGQRSKFSKTITSNEKLSLLRVSPSQASHIRQLINIHSAERKLVDPTTEHLQANKRARTEKSREEIINESEDERSTATNATNNTNNNNNNADERSEVSQARNNATTNGNRQSSDRLNWEYVRRLKPNASFLEEFRVDFPYLEKT
jgi:hypothetical protein